MVVALEDALGPIESQASLTTIGAVVSSDLLRQVLILAYYQGLKYRDIADILGIPVGTVKSRLNRGTKTMRAAIDADDRVVPFDRERIA